MIISRIFKLTAYTIVIGFLLILIVCGFLLLSYKDQIITLITSSETLVNNSINELDQVVQKFANAIGPNGYLNQDMLLDELKKILAKLNELNTPSTDLTEQIRIIQELKDNFSSMDIELTVNTVQDVVGEVKTIKTSYLDPVTSFIKDNFQMIGIILSTIPSAYIIIWGSFGFYSTLKMRKKLKQLIK